MKRWHQEIAVMVGRLRDRGRTLGRLGIDDHLAGEMGRYRKRSPHDCGNPRCGICHSTKRWPPSRANERRASIERASAE